MVSVYVVHYHEIALKGRNRPDFLRKLQENICATAGLGKGRVRIVSGRLIVIPDHDRGSRQSLDSRFRGNDIESGLPPALIGSLCYLPARNNIREVILFPTLKQQAAEGRP